MQKECYTKGMNQSTAHIKFLSELSSYGSELVCYQNARNSLKD